ncbi:hypothetical protein BDZ45DRAFT_747567 [Acephala macrosclerotiorum]|nr:hypothetical protein BDZ45DRAFT_747567 [Acephala macrosclerotiorum]
MSVFKKLSSRARAVFSRGIIEVSEPEVSSLSGSRIGKLPIELILCLVEAMPPATAASFSLTCRSILQIVGGHYLDKLYGFLIALAKAPKCTNQDRNWKVKDYISPSFNFSETFSSALWTHEPELLTPKFWETDVDDDITIQQHASKKLLLSPKYSALRQCCCYHTEYQIDTKDFGSKGQALVLTWWLDPGEGKDLDDIWKKHVWSEHFENLCHGRMATRFLPGSTKYSLKEVEIAFLNHESKRPSVARTLSKGIARMKRFLESV